MEALLDHRHRIPRAASVPGENELRAERLIAAIDGLLSEQVDAILHAPGFQALEALWRQLHTFVVLSRPMRQVRVKLLDVSWAELHRDIARASEFDQSTLFRLVYSEQLGSPGGEPFGVVIVDHAVSHLPGGPAQGQRAHDDVTVLQTLAAIGAAAFCPFLLGASPRLLDLEDWTDAGPMFDVASPARGASHQRWQSLRQNEDTRFLGLLLPRLLVRRPHEAVDRHRRDGFRYRGESVGADGPSSGMLWGNPAFAFAGTVIRLFDESGWFADLRGVRQDAPGAGLVDWLPVHRFNTDAGMIAGQPPVEVRLSAAQEQALTEVGLIPVTAAPYTRHLMFRSNPSLHAPKAYDRPDATWNARISAMLQYVFCVSRFAHYLLVMMRESVGSFKGAGEVQARLNAWLQKYTLGNDDPSQEARARYPLREAFVEVYDVPGRPGALGCTIRLKPHFQIDSIAASFKLVTAVGAR